MSLTSAILRALLPSLPLRDLAPALRRLRAEAIFAELSVVYRAEEAAHARTPATPTPLVAMLGIPLE